MFETYCKSFSSGHGVLNILGLILLNNTGHDDLSQMAFGASGGEAVNEFCTKMRWKSSNKPKLKLYFLHKMGFSMSMMVLILYSDNYFLIRKNRLIVKFLF